MQQIVRGEARRGELRVQLVRGEPGVGLARRVGPPTRSPRLASCSCLVTHQRCSSNGVAESVIKGLSDVQRRYDAVKGDSEWIRRMRQQGNERAQKIARERMGKIREIIGFPPQQ
jgi:hypothetical protein